jgi:hypothetical protein
VVRAPRRFSEFCVVELGTLQAMGPMAAQALLADALDLRYRLPRLWRQVRAGQVRAWQARKVAEQTRRWRRNGTSGPAGPRTCGRPIPTTA